MITWNRVEDMNEWPEECETVLLWRYKWKEPIKGRRFGKIWIKQHDGGRTYPSHFTRINTPLEDIQNETK